MHKWNNLAISMGCCRKRSELKMVILATIGDHCRVLNVAL